MEYGYNRYRVKSPVKPPQVVPKTQSKWSVGFRASFRDLEVYQKTIQLSDQTNGVGAENRFSTVCWFSSITNLPFLNKTEFEQDNKEIKSISENIPKLIAEAYGDKFDSREIAHKKLTDSVTLITDAITKIDLFRQRFTEQKDAMEVLTKLLTQYQYQKRKVLNLRKAWQRVFTNAPNHSAFSSNYKK